MVFIIFISLFENYQFSATEYNQSEIGIGNKKLLVEMYT